jgi:hypothetical protein
VVRATRLGRGARVVKVVTAERLTNELEVRELVGQ